MRKKNKMIEKKDEKDEKCKKIRQLDQFLKKKIFGFLNIIT